MGWYIRKSVRVGMLRFNLSKSGVGTSVGVKGFRLGTGPHGNYVHMGRGGLYFRQTLSPGRGLAGAGNHAVATPPAGAASSATHGGGWAEIQNAMTAQLRGSSDDGLVQEINETRTKLSLFPFAAVLCLAGPFASWAINLPDWVTVSVAILGLCTAVMVHHHDVMAKTVVLLYDLEEQAHGAYQQLQDAFDALLACQSVQLVQAKSRGTDPKYHAGTSNITDVGPITLSRGQVSTLKTNINIPKIATKSQTLAFLPDRLLVFDSLGAAAVPYNELSVEVSSVKWLQNGRLPSDAQVIDHTWQYVNKDGGPDRRFANNPRIPIAKYEQIYLGSGSGLNILLNCSHAGVGEPFKQAIATLAVAAVGSANGAEEGMAANVSTSRSVGLWPLIGVGGAVAGAIFLVAFVPGLITLPGLSLTPTTFTPSPTIHALLPTPAPAPTVYALSHILAPSLNLPRPLPLPGTGTRAFPETDETVTGIFLDFWSEHGGLGQFGYPISGVTTDMSPLNGNAYTVQYFERSVFEYHAGDSQPSKVQLSLLGKYRYTEKYPSGPTTPGYSDHSGQLFPEAHHYVSGPFLQYWQTHGQLTLLGYPISDMFYEKSIVDGKVYLVQYFERSELEIHPENPPPYDVLQAQLGTLRYKANYGSK